MKKLLIFIALSAAVAFIAFSEEGEHHDEHESPGNVGPGKAVTKASPEEGFQLSEAALKTLGIRTMVVEAPELLPKESLVFYQDMVGVYWLRDGWFKLIRPGRVEAGDTIVTSGADLLRVVELDLFTEDVEGHGH